MDTTVVSTDGTRLAVRRSGQGDPVVLIHGTAGGLDSFDLVVEQLADEFELWTYARRGYLPSNGPGRRKSFADDVADLSAVLSAIGRPAHAVGTSYGATVLLHALRAGVPAKGAALFEPPLFATGPTLEPLIGKYRDLVTEGRLATAARLLAEQVSQVPVEMLGPEPEEPWPIADPDPDAVAEAWGCLHDLEAMTADDGDVTRWSALPGPLLLMRSELTWTPMPITMSSLLAVLPRSTEETVFPGQSHFVTHTAPGLFADRLRTFLRSTR